MASGMGTQTDWVSGITNFGKEPEKGEFVGLSNQGATCYLNSLLQTLFMSPEFRHRIYQWEYDPEKHGETEDCIPYQLQLLFGKLQITDRPYVSTKQLTKSFGWDRNESF
jgi:ubiquitin carboxyl-terminal hydrolase 47